MKRRDEIVELFSNTDPDIIYVPRVTDKIAKISVAAHGNLYSHYKYIRKLLREAGSIVSNENSRKSSTAPEGIQALEGMQRWYATK